ncbi:CxxxxCH/CxxCH domain-containing protein [candidate division KSB1 bacterium]|nr:CxxxxCH/CxxCH domain-containing protein [candidate division KSB1 bacterium]
MNFSKTFSLIVVSLAAMFLVSNCSKLKKDLPTQAESETQLHQAGWTDTTSTAFHGVYLLQHNWNLAECKKCHGDDYAGGTAKSSCFASACHHASPETSCTTCHGGVDNSTGAPPKDIANNKSQTAPGVGAHTVHLEASRWSNPVACNECHKVPTSLYETGHVDSDLPAELVWGEFTKTGGLTPTYQNTTCNNVYCHGASLNGGSDSSPLWTQTESMTCNNCHGLPPATGAHIVHVEDAGVQCGTCHVGYEKNVSVDKTVHINGVKNVQLVASIGGTYANGKCANTACHGSGGSPTWDSQIAEGCTGCHGGVDNQTGAPPKDMEGNTARTARGVGAHSAHVEGSLWANAMDCSECHLKPADASAPGHIDGSRPADITWGDLAKNDGQSPAWNGTVCNNVYCHGTSLDGGANTAPSWTDTTPIACNSCHGSPPASGAHTIHLDRYDLECNVCHNGYEKDTSVNLTNHINGTVDVTLTAALGGTYGNGVCANVFCHGGGDSPAWTTQASYRCTSCHGGIDNDTGAPPADLRGNTTKLQGAVGAHTTHVENPRWGQPVDCDECHVVPNAVSDADHIGIDAQAEVTFGALARRTGLSPSWDGTSCSDVYCHGGSLDHGTNTSPAWLEQQRLDCNACHSLPPSSGAHEEHVEGLNIDCDICHDGYEKNDTVDATTHINGVNEVVLSSAVGGSYADGKCANVSCHGSKETPRWYDSGAALSCIGCHGGTDNTTGAPPIDLSGNTDRSSRGVGAHTLHVQNLEYMNSVDCNQCHIKPTAITDPGHIDFTPMAEMNFGTLASADGLSPAWNGTTCTSVYCHGGSLADGAGITGDWTHAGTVECQSCHGLPPTSGSHTIHTETYSLACETCHVGYVKNTSVVKATHIDGKNDVELSSTVGGTYSNSSCSGVICHGTENTITWGSTAGLSCTGCHGGLETDEGAPPHDLSGNAVTIVKGVGAHTAHLAGGNISAVIACTECHVKPAATSEAGHIGPELLPAELTWGSLATTDGATPSWDGISTCENVYCHGEFTYGNKDNNPSWIIVDGSQEACGTCHALPPASPHPANDSCVTCHPRVVDANKNIIGKELHINGQSDLF